MLEVKTETAGKILLLALFCLKESGELRHSTNRFEASFFIVSKNTTTISCIDLYSSPVSFYSEKIELRVEL